MAERYRSQESQEVVGQWCRARLAGSGVPHERRSVPTEAGSTHLLLAGDGPATVLLLPGTNMGAATSLPLVDALAGRVRTVVADLPGQPGLTEGRVPRRGRGAAYGTWAGQVVAELVRQRLVRGRLVVVGHSLGAAVALAAPVEHVAALVLVDPAGLVGLQVTPEVLRATLPWVLRPTPSRSRRLLEHMSAPGRAPAEQLVEWLTLVARHTRPVGAPGPLPDHVLARWRGTPVHVLSGEHDCFLPPHVLAPAVRERLGTGLEVLPGLGHLAVEDDPAAVAREVLVVALRA
jgi:pimeloyl-ACP methyl ester carboxylesterase